MVGKRLDQLDCWSTSAKRLFVQAIATGAKNPQQEFPVRNNPPNQIHRHFSASMTLQESEDLHRYVLELRDLTKEKFQEEVNELVSRLQRDFSEPFKFARVLRNTQEDILSFFHLDRFRLWLPDQKNEILYHTKITRLKSAHHLNRPPAKNANSISANHTENTIAWVFSTGLTNWSHQGKGKKKKGTLFAYPLVINKAVRGVLTFTASSLIRPAEELHHSLQWVTVQMGTYLERRWYQESVQRHEALLIHSENLGQTGGVHWTLDGNKTVLTKGMRRILGVRKNPGILSLRQLLHYCSPEDLPKLLRSFRQLQGGTTFESPVVRIRSRKGRPRKFVILRGRPVFNPGGSMVSFIGSVADVTESHRLAQKQKELREVEDLSKMGRLARAMAHEIRNPLTNIVLSNKQLENKADPNDKTTGMLHEIISRNSNRIEELVSELLESARPKQVSLQTVDIRQLIREVEGLFRDRAKLKNVSYRFDFRIGKPKFKADPEQLPLALLNIITNGIEAMENVSRKILTLEVEDEDQWILIRISDTGIGMSQEDASRIFEPFFSRKKKGLGVGMAATRSIISGHRGRIEVESRLQQGTSFLIFLPKDPKHGIFQLEE